MHYLSSIFTPSTVKIYRAGIALAAVTLWAALFVPSARADDPTFGVRQALGISVEVTRGVAVGDLDNNGTLDVVVANYADKVSSAGQNVYFLNNGQRGFEGPIPLGSEQEQTTDVTLGDMNGDGALDIVLVNERTANAIYWNDGQANFRTQTTFGLAESESQSVAVADLNGDGLLDIVEGIFGNARNGQANQVYLNLGDGNFAPPAPVGSDTDQTLDVAVADLDGKNGPDLVVANFSQPNKIYFNNGQGQFPQAGAFTFDSSFASSYAVVVANLDADPRPDVVVGNDHSRNRVLLNFGGGQFSTNRQFGSADDASASFDVADLNGDGALDIAVGNRGGQNAVILNDGSANFQTSIPFGPGSDETTHVAVADFDGDGAFDLLAGNDTQQNSVYFQNRGGNFSAGVNLTADTDIGDFVAVADIDRQNGLDIVSIRTSGRHAVYFNDGRGGFGAPTSFGQGVQGPSGLAVGDLNNDGLLDIVETRYAEANAIYLGRANNTFAPPVMFGVTNGTSSGVALADVDRNGKLDIIVTNDFEDSMLYFNDGAENFTRSAPLQSGTSFASSVAVGDLTGNGAPDIVLGGYLKPSRVYLNDGQGNFGDPLPFGPQKAAVNSVAVADFNRDGALDILTGNNFQQNAVYFNDGTGSFPTRVEVGPGSDSTVDALAGDVNNDGWPDAVIINDNNQQNTVYLNNRAGGFSNGIRFGAAAYKDFRLIEQSGALGDFNGDGALDIVVANDNRQVNTVFFNGIGQRGGLLNNPPTLTVARPGSTPDANFFTSAVQLDAQNIPITFTITDLESDPLGRVEAFYSLNGGGTWSPALPSADTPTTGLAATPVGVTHVFTWDTFASGLFGQSDNVVLRLVGYPGPQHTVTGTYRYTDSTAAPAQRPFVAAATFPFGAQGTQVQVISGTTPVSGALVYRLPAGKSAGGRPFAPDSGPPFVTDSRGFLQGGGQIGVGDQLLALAPLPLPLEVSRRTSGTMQVYLTNGTPTESGLNARIGSSNSFTVTQPGIQQLPVSAEHPLTLFDLVVTLDWDASRDPAYLSQLEFDLKRASQHLYDFTDGQVAMRNIAVNQNGDFSDNAHILVHATNRLRPHATIGGVVLTDTAFNVSPTQIITYSPGQVHMGSTWNRYGNPNQSIGVDWPVILAHELGHYLLFLEDTYLGLKKFDNADVLTSVESCAGSAMGDVYNAGNTEFATAAGWLPNCANTLAQQELGRPEWETITHWYPWLNAPQTPNPGPNLMPFDLTTVQIFPPDVSANPLEDPTFYLNYAGSQISTSSARAWLLRNRFGSDDFDTVIDLGSPVGGQNRLLARGAAPGDRLCVFDSALTQFGCHVISPGVERLKLRKSSYWRPVIKISPVHSTTFDVTVEGIALQAGQQLRAKLYPAAAQPITETVPFTLDDGVYRTQFQLDQPALSGAVQLWIENDSRTPRREAIVGYSIGGNPGTNRGGGGTNRGGGGTNRGGGAIDRAGEGTNRGGGGTNRGGGGTNRGGGAIDRAGEGTNRGGGGTNRGGGGTNRGGGAIDRAGEGTNRGGGGTNRGGGGTNRGGGGTNRGGGGFVQGEGRAPAVSPDGQMTYFDRNFNLRPGEFYAVQDMSTLPQPLPAGKVAIGRGYNLLASGFPTGTAVLTGSVSFQYRGTDVLVEQQSENNLGIHFWDDARQHWLALNTDVISRTNLASARSRGPGVYALLAGITTPKVRIVTPATATSGITQSVTIRGRGFLEPMRVILDGPTRKTVTPQSVSRENTGEIKITVQLPATLPPGEYSVSVSNGNQPGGDAISPQPGRLALFEPDNACFYDFFDSGAGQWKTDGEWGIVTILPDGRHVLTDSPNGPYKNAGDYGPGNVSQTSAATSIPLDLSRCTNPALTFRHNVQLAAGDYGRVELSDDNGETWRTVLTVTGQLSQTVPPPAVSAAAGRSPVSASPEWGDSGLQPVGPLNLTGLNLDRPVFLRFSLTANNDGLSARGWVIDDVRITESP